ncbi:MAG: D-alanine--poly(phosphoribitol) ligase subunit DltA [Clostridiales Family XIII bacterium]|jgi:D-alanine--poly(phosphoribitol) ligase subunit 1|nr:D-alanine--poly(phosphoribitol) ligase subunit DltA [Clostridiales Family XIII bacterium]
MQKYSLLSGIHHWMDVAPDSVCFQNETETFTYRDLELRSDVLAETLSRFFPGNEPILCFGGLNFNMIVSFLACVKSNHPYIPVDISTPEHRIEAIRQISGCHGILTTDEWPFESESLGVSKTETRPIAKLPRYPVSAVRGDENFYIIFTSGTTGAPKGVQISHDNLISFTDWMLRDFGIENGKRFLIQAPYSFDLSVMSLLPALLTGGTLAAIGKSAVTDFNRLFSAIPKLDLNIWVSTPSFADVCLADPGFNEKENPGLSHFLFCGDELPHATATKLLERFPGARVFNTYGPTEATVAVTQIEITRDVLSAHGRLPVGYAKPDTVIAILDEDGKELPEGEVGEIVIAGPPVSKGYINDPKRTAESFFLYHSMPAYRTGDAGFLKEDLLFYKGRLDFQVKFHGYRIETQDIEQHLERNDYVKAALVVPEYKDYKVRRLVACVVPEAHPFGKESELTSSLKTSLAASVMDYMVPQKFIYLDSLPLTANGKVDRKKMIDRVNGKP